ncbi:MAG: PhnD/SsuA/transferrin family substrate-binding protein [Gammaproteobacteria bacterium]|nr:PhnD/SsuA/transferrin family substrate-binding protein [Gammaproteobacteria bacterium]
MMDRQTSKWLIDHFTLYIKIMILILLMVVPSHTLSVETNEQHDIEIRIGVLAKRGINHALKKWEPTIDYLNQKIPGHHFIIKPLGFDAIFPAVENKQVDFVLSNPFYYVELEALYGIQPIATLKNKLGSSNSTFFGGVIIVRSDNQNINSLADIKGKSLLAVDKNSLGGFLMAWGELEKNNINPYEDLSQLEFVGSHDQVVKSLRDGHGDVGTVRTDTLERMEQEGLINIENYRVINAQVTDNKTHFDFLRSTSLYSEWPFAKLPSTSDTLSKSVAIALLDMPESSTAAQSALFAGWDVAQNYSDVHELLKRLKVGLYHDWGKVSFKDVIRLYWHWMLLGFLALLAMIAITGYVSRLNKSLNISRQSLQKAKDELDIRVQERTQELANISQEKQLLLTSVAEGIYGIDVNGNAIFFNPAAESMLGFSVDEVIGRPNHILFHHTHSDGSNYPESECKIGLSIRDRKIMKVNDEVFWRKDGSSFPVEYISSPLMEDNQVVGAVIVFTDITERQKAQEKIKAQDELILAQSRHAAMGEMISMIAHQWRQPISVIAMEANNMLADIEFDEVKLETFSQDAKRIIEQTRYLSKTIDDFRNFFKPGKTKDSVVPQKIMEECLDIVGKSLEHNNIVVITNYQSHRNLLIHSRELLQVLINIIKNAKQALIEHCQDNRNIRIDIYEADNNLKISISDNAGGIDTHIKNKIFDPYFSTKDKKSGTGLGLYMSKIIIEKHMDGNIEVENIDNGSKFTITVPMDGD